MIFCCCSAYYILCSGQRTTLSISCFVLSSVRLISRKRHNLSTVLPPPPISPLNMVKDVTYNREFNMMYLLINEQEIWVYYTRYDFVFRSFGQKNAVILSKTINPV